jgi:hypothetical protein
MRAAPTAPRPLSEKWALTPFSSPDLGFIPRYNLAPFI